MSQWAWTTFATGVFAVDQPSTMKEKGFMRHGIRGAVVLAQGEPGIVEEAQRGRELRSAEVVW